MHEALHYQQEGQLGFGRAPTAWEPSSIEPCPIGTRKNNPRLNVLTVRVYRDAR
jgi:hypothetical protein